MNRFYKYMRRVAVAVALIGVAVGVKAGVTDLPVKEVNGTRYYFREVKPKETVYGICRELGLSKSELVRFNSAVADGLKAGMTLYFPVADFGDVAEKKTSTEEKKSGKTAPATAVPQTDIHLVEKGETIYGVSHRYGITEDELIAANPQLAHGMKKGTILHIPAPSVNPASGSLPEAPEYSSVAPAEPVGEVAEEVAEIPERAIGAVCVYDEETEPAEETEAVEEPEVAEAAEAVAVEEPVTPVEPVDSVSMVAVEEVVPTVVNETPALPDTVRVAILFPFMLSQENPEKQAQLYTEFYKGFLLAVDSLKGVAHVPMVISAYDTAADSDTLRAILSSPAFAGTNLIIPSDNEPQLSLVERWARQNGAYVLNIFAVRNDLFRTSPVILQANIPHTIMYEKAAEAFLHEFPGYTPVIVSSKSGRHDKDEFVEVLRRSAVNAGVPPIEVDYEGLLKEDDLKMLDASTGRYVFVTTSGNSTEFNRVMPAIKAWRDALTDFNSARIFGYPEWITFRGDALQTLHYMNAVVYSRFFDDDTSPRSRDVSARFLGSYGHPMISAVPRQGLLGFDTGNWLINAINTFGQRRELSFDGVQTGYRFTELPDAKGKVNDVLYLINFRPSGLINKTPVD